MQKKTVDHKEFQKAAKWCGFASLLILIVFLVTSVTTGNWKFLFMAMWSVFLVNMLTLPPLYAAYKKNEKKGKVV